MENDRFHHTTENYYKLADRSLERGIREGRISEDDAHLIRAFVDERSTRLSPSRYFKSVSILVTVRKFFSAPYRETKKADLFGALRLAKAAKKADGKPYTQNTVADFSKFIKRFFTWLAEEGTVEIPIATVKEMGTIGYSTKTKADGDILTAEEITAIISAARTAKYKALIGVLYEGGFRISEVASLKWKDITFLPWGAKIRTDGKTGKLRTVPIISYVAYLANWQASYPGGNPGPDDWVFITPEGKPVQYMGVRKAIKGFVQEAGITKKVTLHSFRHSRITHVLRGGMQETLCKKAFWGNQSTNMIECYSHLIDEDIDQEFARQAGIELEGKKESGAPEPVTCPGCHTVMPPGSWFCNRCGAKLTQEAIKSVADAEKVIERWLTASPSRTIELAERIQEEEKRG
ncbi:tyrosine-type recombinase/integrase [Methanocalculus natronophilus]|uniref:tyrosine-type recombinase/integrase n=1 Tax=Methanocalculus natronophilus TaxID=1262400 RepID=UPI0031B64E97